HWNGQSWQLTEIPAPPGDGWSRLDAVTALAPATAWAVGAIGPATTKGYPYRTLVERWDGRSWTQLPSPSPGTWANDLFGVWAADPAHAWTAGWYQNVSGSLQPLLLGWDGQSWTTAALAPAGDTGELEAVSGTGRTDAWAVGDTVESGE